MFRVPYLLSGCCQGHYKLIPLEGAVLAHGSGMKQGLLATVTSESPASINDNPGLAPSLNAIPSQLSSRELLCQRIFRFACTDDGPTGRSLSLVSQYVHDTSKSYKLQSIIITSAS
jgi:hypothetical protein